MVERLRVLGDGANLAKSRRMSSLRVVCLISSLALTLAGCGCPEQVVSHFPSLQCSTDGGAGAFLVTPNTDLGNVRFTSDTTCSVSVDAGVVSLTLSGAACSVMSTAPMHGFMTAPCPVGPLAAGTYDVDGRQLTVFTDGGVDLARCH